MCTTIHLLLPHQKKTLVQILVAAISDHHRVFSVGRRVFVVHPFEASTYLVDRRSSQASSSASKLSPFSLCVCHPSTLFGSVRRHVHPSSKLRPTYVRDRRWSKSTRRSTCVRARYFFFSRSLIHTSKEASRSLFFQVVRPLNRSHTWAGSPSPSHNYLSPSAAPASSFLS